LEEKMKALLIIDAQKAILDFKDFTDRLVKIEKIARDFKSNKEAVILIRNVSDDENDPFYLEGEGSLLHPELKEYADYVIEKRTPSAFFQTELQETLEQLGADHIYITGFETEFCCQFTAIAGYDRGYKVTFIEDATGTVNDEKTYEMKELNIGAFVGTVLDWSGAVEVLYFEEYLEKQKE